MKRVSPQKKLPRSDWSLTGQLKLAANSTSAERLDDWMKETLAPFHLPADLSRKLHASVREGLSRLNAAAEISPVLTVKVFVSQEVQTDHPTSKSWGFFQLEKRETGLVESVPVEHVIGFYLYLDV